MKKEKQEMTNVIKGYVKGRDFLCKPLQKEDLIKINTNVNDAINQCVQGPTHQSSFGARSIYTTGICFQMDAGTASVIKRKIKNGVKHLRIVGSCSDRYLNVRIYNPKIAADILSKYSCFLSPSEDTGIFEAHEKEIMLNVADVWVPDKALEIVGAYLKGLKKDIIDLVAINKEHVDRYQNILETI